MKNAIKINEKDFICPDCGNNRLVYFSGDLEMRIPEHIYCPICVNKAYDPETGQFICLLPES